MIETLRGSITAAGTASGHQFVIGWWDESPIGAFADIMWAKPDGSKQLVAPADHADFITSVYPFDTVIDAPVEIERLDNHLSIEAGPLQIELELRRIAIPFPPRPRWITSTIENMIARGAMGVSSYGTSPTGVDEWYRTASVRPIRSGEAWVDGESCGPVGPLRRPIGFGFTDPPARPAHVRLRVDLRR